MTDDTGAVRRAVAGDVTAFGALVRLHQSALRGFLRRLTRGNHALADDLAQETFLEAHRKIGQFQGTGSFVSWLYAIAWSRFLMETRKRRLEPLDDDFAETHAFTPEPASVARLDLERAFTQLKPAERAALTLCFAAGLSHDEAATALAMPLGTLKSHVARGREKLKTLLQDQAHEP
jgi:RNA polymerase sigma-70 factor (ECF subfamily)